MKTWEETEFEMQQYSIEKWAEKKYKKMLKSWYFRRKLRKITKLARIITGNKKIRAYVSLREVRTSNAEQLERTR